MPPKKRIGDLLIEAGVLNEEQLQRALLEQKQLNLRLGDLLISQNYITEQQLFEVLEYQLGIRHIQLFRQKIDQRLINLIPQKLAEQHRVLPVRTDGNKLIVAMEDPLDYFAIDEIRMATGMRVEAAIASKDELQRAIKRFYGLQESVQQIMQTLDVPDEALRNAAELDENSPVVKTVNQIIIQAVQIGASDIHIDPQEDSLRIRYRVDGVMRTERTLPPHMHNVITARLKIMGNMDVAERRLPQDGRVEMEVEFRKIDIRMSSLPTIHGEKIVLRILDMSNIFTKVDELSFSERNLRIFRDGLHNPYGMVLITGPTGSGKTTTLYAGLAELNSDEVNIITVEDPVEYQLAGINQVQVRNQTGLTFANGLRSILRQDPNIVMVGEIRDSETADIAVRAAMTGHLVLSTLHTNSAVNAITRLIDMDIEPFLVASSLSCIVAQRLVRRICRNCQAHYIPLKEHIAILEENGITHTQLFKGMGCKDCGHSGYRGRIAIQEVLMVDHEIRSMILQKRADTEYMAHAVSEGMIPMFKDGLSKVVEGLTTIEEVIRVTRSRM